MKLDQPAMLVEVKKCYQCPFAPDNSGLCEIDSNVMVNYGLIGERPPKNCPLRSRSYLIKIADALIAAGEK